MCLYYNLFFSKFVSLCKLYWYYRKNIGRVSCPPFSVHHKVDPYPIHSNLPRGAAFTTRSQYCFEGKLSWNYQFPCSSDRRESMWNEETSMLFGSFEEGRRGDGTKAREEEAKIRRLCRVLVWLFWPYTRIFRTLLLTAWIQSPFVRFVFSPREVVFNSPFLNRLWIIESLYLARCAVRNGIVRASFLPSKRSRSLHFTCSLVGQRGRESRGNVESQTVALLRFLSFSQPINALFVSRGLLPFWNLISNSDSGSFSSGVFSPPQFSDQKGSRASSYDWNSTQNSPSNLRICTYDRCFFSKFFLQTYIANINCKITSGVLINAWNLTHSFTK